MCGLAGIITHGTKPAKKQLQAAAAALAHRGPDGNGIHIHNNVGFVHTRLSIIDLAGGAQPLTSEDGRYTLVANGEIYHYKSLQKQAEKDGWPLKTASDCEPLLYLYNKHGLHFVDHFQGMVALALHDTHTDDVILARDAFGIKPLYYAQTPKGFAFASEPQALVAAGWMKPEVNQDALPAFLNRQYAGGTDTLWHGIYRVAPGEVLRIREGHIVQRYQRQTLLKQAQRLSEDEALEALEDHLFSAVQSHLQSDVPYGAFLSGGIDSSAMVTTMQKIVDEKEPVRTFTVGFESTTVADERTDAENLATSLSTKHTSVSFGEKDFWQQFKHMVRFIDDPVADYAALPLLKLSARAKKDVKVILSGEGGDEMLAGYSRYRPNWWDVVRGKTFRGRGTTKGFESLFTCDLSSWQELPSPSPAGLTALQKSQYTDIQTWLPDDLLTKVDRCLMAHGIEGRVPYLDDTFAAFAFALPDGLKVKGKHGKWLLKKWLSENSQANVWRRKRGFTVPVQAWLDKQRPALTAYFAKHEGVQELCHASLLTQLLGQPLNKRSAKLLFHLLVFAGWHEVHIQKNRFSIKVKV